MAQRVSVAITGAKPVAKSASSYLTPNPESEGLKLALDAMDEGQVVSTKGMSKEEYMAWARARVRERK